MQNIEEVIGLVFWSFFILLGIAYVFFAAPKHWKKVAAQLSQKPDLNKQHPIRVEVVLPKSIEEVWPYISDSEKYKQWNPDIKNIVPVTGDPFAQDSKMVFHLHDRHEKSVDVTVMGREDKNLIGFYTEHTMPGRFNRYEWIILERESPSATKMIIVCDYQLYFYPWLYEILIFASLKKYYKKALQRNAELLRKLLAN